MQQGPSPADFAPLEAGIQVGDSVIIDSPSSGLAIASVHERRDGFRKLLGRPDRRAELDLARKRLRREKSAG